jgi:YtxH-like protein
MRRNTRNNLLQALLGAGLYMLDPVRERLSGRLDDLSERAQDTYESALDRLNDVSDRLRGRHTNGWNNALWALLGVGVGVGVGMLLAPASGQETRSSLSEKAQEVGSRVRSRFSSGPKSPTGTYGGV